MQLTIEKVEDRGDSYYVRVDGEGFVIPKSDIAMAQAGGEDVRRVALTLALASGLNVTTFEGRTIHAFEPADIALLIAVRVV